MLCSINPCELCLQAMAYIEFKLDLLMTLDIMSVEYGSWLLDGIGIILKLWHKLLVIQIVTTCAQV